MTLHNSACGADKQNNCQLLDLSSNICLTLFGKR
jgi:hypothetical protein